MYQLQPADVTTTRQPDCRSDSTAADKRGSNSKRWTTPSTSASLVRMAAKYRRNASKCVIEVPVLRIPTRHP